MSGGNNILNMDLWIVSRYDHVCQYT